MKVQKMAIKVNNIRQAAGLNGLPGNYIINQKTDDKGAVLPECWFNSRELRNSILGSGVNANIPCFIYQGCTITFERLTVEQSDIDAAKAAGKAGLEYKLTGRKEPVVYKQPGVHNINATLDMSSLNADKMTLVSDLSMKYRQIRTAPAPAPAPDQTAEEIVEEVIEDDKPTTKNDEHIEHENLEEKAEEPKPEEVKQ